MRKQTKETLLLPFFAKNSFFFGKKTNKNPFGEKLKIYWIHFIQNISNAFFIPSKKTQLTEHEALCKDVLSIYTYFSFELFELLDEEVWNVLQFTLLDTTHKLLTLYKPQSIDNISFGMSEALISVTFSLFFSQNFFWFLFISILN